MASMARPTNKIRPLRQFAEVTAVRGRSKKTVRRPVRSGLLPSDHTGRRVLFACGDADRFIQSRRVQAMAIAPEPVSPYRSVDIHGRALPMTEEEILRRNAGAIRALDEVAEMGDEEEQRATLEALMTSIDEEPLSARRRFR
jgi:hypothetical protein